MPGEWGTRGSRTASQPDYRLRYHYNITLAQYEWMLEVQGGVCAICGTDNPGGKRKMFAVDHDHQTGQIRGLLCYHCNVGIGHFEDDVARLQRAIAYLKRSAKRAG